MLSEKDLEKLLKHLFYHLCIQINSNELLMSNLHVASYYIYLTFNTRTDVCLRKIIDCVTKI